jgi:predicted metallo-beta-lactamase superfamily hydrolase
MKILPLVAESLGTRGMCIFVTTEDQTILVDPSVSLGPLRYGLKPHLQEIAAAYLSRQLILKAVNQTSILVQTHYHGDHFTLGVNRPYEFTNRKVQTQIYGNPNLIILAKDPKKNTNYNQKKRASWLWKKKGITLYSGDNKRFSYGKTTIKFSPPIPHGREGSRSGWVLSVFIEDSQDSVLITSDVHGLASDAALNFILENNAHYLILDGPSTYHPKQTEEETAAAFRRMRKIPHNRFYLDHHFLRDRNWSNILKENNLSVKAVPLSELVINEPLCLESIRDELYKQEPMNDSFHSLFHKQRETVMDIIKDTAVRLPFSKLEGLLEHKHY